MVALVDACEQADALAEDLDADERGAFVLALLATVVEADEQRALGPGGPGLGMAGDGSVADDEPRRCTLL